MPHNRYFTPDPETLKQDELNHFTRVMRGKVHDLIEGVDGKGSLYEAEVIKIGKEEAGLKILNQKKSPLPYPMVIVQAFPRLNRIDYILEKGCELGMTEIILFPGDLSEKNEVSPSQIKRFEKILISALKQSGTLWLPKITFLSSLYSLSLPYPLYFGDVRPSAPLFSSHWKKNNGSAFVIGPEKGLSPKEIAFLESKKAEGVTLHPNILRTDTASLTALSLMSHWLL